MSSADVAFTIILISTILTGLLFVLFGEITVRRLRKNPETKKVLGIERVSGRDIMNVAMALSVPRMLNRRARRSKISFMFANADVLYQYTNRFDRILARVFYWTFVATGVWIIVGTILFL